MLSIVVPLVVTRCHSLYHSLSFVVTRCTTCCHSLSFVVTRCHSLSLVVIRCHLLYHSSVFLCTIFFIIFYGEKQKNRAISYHIKKAICFNIYKSACSDNIAKASGYLFNVCLTIMHFVFCTFGLASSEESEENPPSRIIMQLIH